MSLFERYLALWVALCIVAGIALGHVLPGLFQAIGGLEVAHVNLPVAVLICGGPPVAPGGQGRRR